MQITPAEIAETLAMVNKEHLDIRTITLGLNLRGCTDSDIDTMARKVYDRMTTAAEQLVPTAEQLEREYGIPIVNKRISVTPIAEICAATDARDLSPIAVAMDKAAKVVGVDFVGGFSALVHKGASRADNNLMDSIPDALAATDFVCSSVNVGSTRAGINMDAAFKMAGIVKKTAEATADRQCIGAGKLVVFCNAVEDNPFMAGAFHGSGEADAVVNVGVSGPGVVRSVLANMPKDADMTAISEAIKATVFKITRAGELMAREASKRLGVTKGILDLSLAPTPAEGDSVAEILETIGVGKCGGPGTTAALAMLNDAVKKGETVKLSYVDQGREGIDPKKNVWEVVSDGLDYMMVCETEVPSRAYVASFGFKGSDQQKPAGVLSGGERNRLNLALTLKQGGNLLLLDEPTNDLDVETLSSLEEALLEFPGCAVVTSHDRMFLDRIATHILAWEGTDENPGNWFWFEGNFDSYQKNRIERLGEEASKPHRLHRKLTRD